MQGSPRGSAVWLRVAVVAVIAGCGAASPPAVATLDAGSDSALAACHAANGSAAACAPNIKVVGPAGDAVANHATVILSAGTDAPQSLTFQVLNTGNSPLAITGVTLDYAPLPGDGTTAALACYGPDGATPCAAVHWPDVASSGGTGASSVAITIVFTNPTDAATRTAALHLLTNDASTPAIPEFIINFKTASAGPKIVTAAKVDLGFVKAPATDTTTFAIQNLGAADLVILEIDATALDDSFTLVIDGTEYPTTALITLTPPITLAPGAFKDVQVVYAAKDNAPHSGDIILHTNDLALTAEGGPGWKRVHVQVNAQGQCLQVLPSPIDFGGQKVGNVAEQTVVLKSCGVETVVVTSIGFDGNGPGSFGIDYTSIAATGGLAPTASAPLTIAKYAQATFNVRYTAAQVSAKAADGSCIEDTAHLVVAAPASGTPTIDVPVSGFVPQ